MRSFHFLVYVWFSFYFKCVPDSFSFDGVALALCDIFYSQLALEDIEEAQSHSPSTVLHSRISNTHKLCLSEMRRQARSHDHCRSPNVAHGQHRSIANASDLIKVNYANEKGRYLEVCNKILNLGTYFCLFLRCFCSVFDPRLISQFSSVHIIVVPLLINTKQIPVQKKLLQMQKQSSQIHNKLEQIN